MLERFRAKKHIIVLHCEIVKIGLLKNMKNKETVHWSVTLGTGDESKNE